ncbi:hypothetical protein NM208_g6710 [Fusarium decemcellulare]|uniref:Uncharacterized protein n=1 Tax=Fusarium decemcellulare TaxID=57161 RepID=A0ACC1SC69_9HYPO|nr:hypothetical protein NM208_g6710 [Fusarium decemcellulare]
MADPFGIIGLIGVAAQLTQKLVELGLDWKDAPTEAKTFAAELQLLKTVLSEANFNIILSSDFRDAFCGRPSVLLAQLDTSDTTDAKSLIELCRSQLEDLLAELTRSIAGGRLGWHRLKGAFLASRTREAVKNLQRQCQMLNNMLAIDAFTITANTCQEVKLGRKEAQQFHDSMTREIFTVQGGINNISDRQDRQNDTETRKTILDWLTPVEFAAQQADNIQRRQPGTGEWLLNSEEYKQWTQEPREVLFCPGIPGAGKTISTSIVINDLLTQIRGKEDKDIGVAWVYCNFKRQDEQKLDTLLLSILKQLAQAQTTFPSDLSTLYRTCEKENTRPNLEEIVQVLQSVCRQYTRTFLVVDALDECQTFDGCRDRFLAELLSLREKSSVNIYATSRFIPDITREFDNIQCKSLEIRATPEDVRNYLQNHINELPSFVRRSRALQEEVIKAILDAVDGMFLLAQLHLGSLIGKRSPASLKSALKKLPKGSDAYDHAYKHAMERIRGQAGDIEQLAIDVLSWIVCAFKPLTIEELRHALAVEIDNPLFDEENLPDAEDIVSSCVGLVTIDDESNIIRLVHYTAQEYFERNKNEWFREADNYMTDVCVSYLTLDEFGSGDCESQERLTERLHTFPLYNHATKAWGHHARVANTVSERALYFLTTPDLLDAASQVLVYDRPNIGVNPQYTRKTTGLHFAAHFGLDKYVSLLLDAGHFADARDGNGRSPLHWAAKTGHINVIKVLLDTEVVDINSKDNLGRTPLFLAIYHECPEAVKALLDRPLVQVDVLDNGGTSPLIEACRRGQLDIAQSLLHQGANPNAPDRVGRTPLYWAALRGYVEIVEKLLSVPGIKLDTKDKVGQTPFLAAATAGHPTVLRLLANTKRIELNPRDEQGCTPLTKAAWFGRLPEVELLLSIDGIDREPVDDWGFTPLLIALRRGHDDVVRVLTPAGGLDSKTQKRYDQTMLSRVAEEGDEELAQSLLQSGADPNFENKLLAPPIVIAAIHENLEVLRLMIEAGGNVNSKDPQHQRTCLSWAAAGGTEHIMSALLSVPGIIPDLADDRGSTPLYVAVWRNNMEAVKLLLTLDGVDPNAEGDRGRYTPLMLAAHEEYSEDIVDVLLRHPKTNREAKNRDGQTALSIAASGGVDKSLKRLLSEQGIEVNTRDKHGRSPLSWAARNGKLTAVCSLLSAGADINSVDDTGHTALMLAVLGGWHGTVQVLLDHGAAVDVGGNSWTALQLAVLEGRAKVEQLLRNHGATEPRDFFGFDMLHQDVGVFSDA